MCKIKTVRSADVFPLVRELLHNGTNVSIIVTGTSMYPFLRPDIDRVELRQVNFTDIKRGDIVLILRKDGAYVLHRVLCKTANEFFIIGDNQKWIEGPLEPGQLVATTASIWRQNKNIDCNNRIWRFFSAIWLGIIPLRGKINRLLQHFDKYVIAVSSATNLSR